MLNLIAVDWMVILLYGMVVLGVGLALRPFIKSSQDYLLAGRSLPVWLCVLGFAGVNLGAPEVIGMGAWGARYGLGAAQIYWLGALPAMLCAGLFLVPVYYGSRARSAPEYLGLRFDGRTRALMAVLSAAMSVATMGILLCALGRLIVTTQVFRPMFLGLKLPATWIFSSSVGLMALGILAYVLLGGLAATLYNQMIQFLLVVAGLLPVVLLGLKSIGGWTGLKTHLAPDHAHLWAAGHAGSAWLAIGLGLALGAGFWCVDTRALQPAFAAKDAESARRVPVLAAIPRLLLPFIVVLPGVLAIGLPTPHSTSVTREQNGAIYHEITVVPQAAEKGQGLVPAHADPKTGKPILNAQGQTTLDYAQATTQMMGHFLPFGLLGLAFTALLAALMSGIAGNLSAFNTVVAWDLFQGSLRKDASDRSLLLVARLAAVVGMALAVAAAFAVAHVGGILAALLLAFSVVNAPALAVFLLGLFWRRATAQGAFAGLLTGVVVALLHHALTLPAGAARGLCGGWLAVTFRYPDALAQGLAGFALALAASLLVTVLVSLVTPARAAAELTALVHTPATKRKRARGPWWQRPERLAIVLLVVVVLLNLIFA